MASPKQAPLSIDDLIDAQKSLMQRSDVTEKQIEIAKQQLKRLEDIKAIETVSNVETAKEDVDINRITRKKGDSSHVSLGDVQTELKGLRKDLTAEGKEPKAGRSPLPLMTIGGEGQAQAEGEAQADAGETQKARRDRLEKIGSLIGAKQEALSGDVNKQTLNSRNTETYDKFIRETGKSNEFMADATAEQKKIFERLEETMIKLRDSDEQQSIELRKEIAGLAGELKETGDTTAKSKMTGIIGNASRSAREGIRGDQGTLGDALQALMGKKDVLKQGFEFDERLQGKKGHMGVRATGPGQTAAVGEQTLGKVRGAATIAGNFFKGQVEEFNNKHTTNAGSDWLNRNFGIGPSRQEKAASITGQMAQIGRGPAVASSSKMAAASILSSAPIAPAAMVPQAAPVSDMASAKVINLKAETVNLSGGGGFGGGGGGSAAPADSGGSAIADFASSAMEKGKAGLSTAGSWLGKAAGAGKNLIGKIPGGALKGGIAALGGAALSYGGDKLKESGHEKLGGAADVAGTAASWGGTGAMLGSVVPGVGTAIGAGVGAVAGGAYGLYKNWGNFFGGGEEAAKPAVAAGGQVQKDAVSPEAMAAWRARNDEKARRIKETSIANSDAKSASAAPVVINNSANQAAAPAPTQNMMLPRGNVRPQESAIERYSQRQAAFY